MKKNFKIIAIILGLSLALFSFIPNNEIPKNERDKLLISLLAYVIEKAHYSPVVIDDKFSKGLYKSYIEDLDPSKRFFLQSDMEDFSKFETQLDDQIKSSDIAFFDLTYNRLKIRMEESKLFYKEILENPFQYIIDEEFNTDFEHLPYADTKEALKDRWRKQLKLSSLASLSDRLEMQENKKNGIEPEKNQSKKNTKIVAKETLDSIPKTYIELEKITRESNLKSLDEYFNIVKDIKREDWFAIYLNAIAERFDPHTSYFAPEDKDKFDVSMSGKLEGIGARLQKKNDYTEISELISGGPAWKGKELESGDLILKVAQGDSEPIDIVGMILNDVVKKIKGPKGTEVKLTVKKVDGTIKIISIIRDIVEIEETYAKSSVVDKNGVKYGVIYLPKFYIDFEDKNARDAAKDIEIEVNRLKDAGVKGIVFDVRDNGGGSLKTVQDIIGLFIADGPVVQVKSSRGAPEVLEDRNKKITWDGPLVVMVNSFSASASEILAAAIQDYKRGIIIGSKQTYGKGTVQNFIDLNGFTRGMNVDDVGSLKTTIQKFYRINGGSTQLEGVKSDVVMPDRYMYLKMGERDVDNALPFDKIDPAPFKIWSKQNNFDAAITNSKVRIAKNSQFKLIEENAKWIDNRSKDNLFNLNIDKYRAEDKQVQTESKKFKELKKYDNKLIFNSLPYEIEAIQTDEDLKEKRKDWHENLAKDVYIEEALNVLDDLQPKLLINKPAVVKFKKVKLAKN